MRNVLPCISGYNYLFKDFCEHLPGTHLRYELMLLRVDAGMCSVKRKAKQIVIYLFPFLSE
jgi:hypothetical protein